MLLVKNTNCQQPLICEKVFLGIEEKFKVSNHRIEDLENQTQEINNINNTLSRLETLISLQREDSLKRDKSIEAMNKTQIEITNTLKTLSESLSKTDKNVDKLNKKVDENHEKFNKKFDDISKDNNISIFQIIKYIIFGSIGVGIGIIIPKIFIG